jgi:hypothetical protein
MKQEERVDKAIAELVEVIRELGQEALEAGEEAERNAEKNVRRFEAAWRELLEARRRVRALEKERAELPRQAYAANLDEDSEREASLRERYKTIPAELEEARRKVLELKEKVRGFLGPNRTLPTEAGHELDIMLVQHGPVRDAYSRGAGRLRAIEKIIRSAVAEAVGPLEGGMDYWAKTLRDWRSEIENDPQVLEYRRAKQMGPQAVEEVRERLAKEALS